MTDENETVGLTNASCTAPQKHVAVASSSVDQPSLARPANGKSFGWVSRLCVMAVGCKNVLEMD